MKLSSHFTLEEMVFSQTAVRRGINNEPSLEIIDNLTRLAQRLEAVRKLLDAPIIITSGYRSPLLNAEVGGSANSAHLLGCAVDFISPGSGADPYNICRLISQSDISFDQMINEGDWVHFAIGDDRSKERRQVLTAHFKDGTVRYTHGLE